MWGLFFAAWDGQATITSMTQFARLFLAALLCASPVLSGAQVLRCTDSAGKVQFSDKPCAPGQQMGEVKIYKQPAAPAPAPAQAGRMSPAAVEYEKARMQRRKQSDESHQRMNAAAREVQQIRSDNRNPRKCAEAQARMARMQAREPVTFKLDPDYFELQQQASLYCGN